MTIRRLLLALPALLLGWTLVLALVMRFSDAAPAAVILFPSASLMAALPDGTAIVDRSAVSVTVANDRPELARALYAKGALLVLPAGLPGCLPLSVAAK